MLYDCAQQHTGSFGLAISVFLQPKTLLAVLDCHLTHTHKATTLIWDFGTIYNIKTTIFMLTAENGIGIRNYMAPSIHTHNIENEIPRTNSDK